ncbi:metallophosphoesterase [Undibacterium sp. LX40W]|uniref:Metallophosphoesterase n=1 Tax=Undibacterium nitidum TaxID=2762298 RepID=A0A923KPA0_9BURK|nr:MULTISPECIES: metallophosphoesterase [Undibacterium]MBC3881553.1 metallophosphoesterase [Undibacterium nitidum]MBC3891665.1 metallophosphoesterase [Undibacterium sp. LX40W]
MNSSYALIQTLPPGTLDIIGDIHGEIDSLRQLLQELGYDEEGKHAENRHLVFVGDYCDRGPDSPAVIALVEKLVKAKRAFAILGNHELNLLRNDAKDGSGWYFDSQYEHDQEKFAPFKRANEEEREQIRSFLLTLPIALEREDIRIVHAAWDLPAIKKLKANEGRPLLDLYKEWHLATQHRLNEIKPLVEQEKLDWPHSLHHKHDIPPMLHAHAQKDVINQNHNPMRILTSGIEREAKVPFYTSGKWRFAERVQWWNEYDEATPVVIGHYWRQPHKIDRSVIGKGDADLFADIEPDAWHGKHQNVFCVDFSVGGKWSARKYDINTLHDFRLGALRWPEDKIFFSTGKKSSKRS